MVTAKDVEKDIQEHEAEWLKLTEESENGPIMDIPFMRQVYFNAEWLSMKLTEAGAEKQERMTACFALGQRLCMNTPEQYSTVTADVFNRWEQGNKDKPGKELGERLVDEALDAG